MISRTDPMISISFNHGAGNRYRVRRAFRVSFSTATVCGVLATMFLTLCTKPLVSLFLGLKNPIIVARGTEFRSVRRSYLRLFPVLPEWYIAGTACSE